MSKSRLEKFLYALYSLDSSDLPTPLSRIEELYKCWVTGEEVPTFEPLSRVEKYLMAILGVYDADELPNPISRVEVLLYKLATGDDNLDDVKSFLSEHEELLAEIIRNGGAGGNNDIEYVLYTLSTEFNTLYNTAEKPIKSAILKGRTLVNLCNGPKDHVTLDKNTPIANLNITRELQAKKYAIIGEVSDFNAPNIGLSLWVSHSDGEERYYNKLAYTNGKFVYLLEAQKEITTVRIYIHRDDRENDGFFNIGGLMLLEYQEGMENWDIPYFEGMQSVKMPVLTTTGKNLFDGELKIGTIFSNGTTGATENCLRSSNYIKLEQNIDYVISNDKGYSHVIFGYNSNKEFVERIGSYSGNGVFKLTGNIEYIMFRSSDTLKQNDLSVKYQIEKGTVATPFEPYKSNILTTPSDLELRGIGDVHDELDCLTGEVTERIGELVLDGSDDEKWTYSINYNFFVFEGLKYTNNYLSTHILDKITWIGTKRFALNPSNYGITSDSEGREYLSNHPITLQYKLESESIKTVDLSVVDQDGDNTKLSTFDDITHVTLSSEGLIPEAELEVATKNEEDLEDSVVYAVHTLSEEFNTLYNTAEKPVKSAILKGSTLVNLWDNIGQHSIAPNDFVRQVVDCFKKSTKYLLKYNVLQTNTNNSMIVQYYQNSTWVVNELSHAKLNEDYYILTTPSADFNNIRLFYANSFGTETVILKDIMLIEYQDGMENLDIPYFEGMQSVKMPVLTTTGKNLYYVSKDDGYYNSKTGVWVNDAKYKTLSAKVLPNTKYTQNIDKNHITFWKDGEFVSGTSNSITFTTPTNCDEIRASCSMSLETYMLEMGDISTSYEPFKSNILTVNEEIELCEVNGTHDELNLLTGELTQRVHELVLDGSEKWNIISSEDGVNTSLYRTDNIIANDLAKVTLGVDHGVSLPIPYRWNTYENDEEGVVFTQPSGHCYVRSTIRNLSDFTQWLMANPITIQYELATESIKTVDLSVVDQDGNDTELSTFNDITHVTLSSEGLIPEAELEVAEKVTEVAASMLAISHEQEVIDTTTNEQSENIDSTMIAATEIYEELL